MKRFKGAIDARIAEEQAKQRAAAQQSPSRPGSTPRRSSSRNLSPSKRAGRSKDADNGKAASTGKGPDPSEFDPEFVIGEDDDQPSRTGTPRPKEKGETADTASSAGKEKEGEGQDASTDEKANSPTEIPPEVQVRLRKLDKLEPKYSGMWSQLLTLYLSNNSQNCYARTASPTLVSALLKPSRPLYARTLP